MFYCDEMKDTDINEITFAEHEPIFMGERRWTRKAIDAEINAYFGEGSHEYFANWTRDELLRDLFGYFDGKNGSDQTLRALDEVKAAHVLAHGIELNRAQ